MVKTTLEKLITALRWIQDDERDFDLSYPVTVTVNGITIPSDGFLFQKIIWFLQLAEQHKYDGDVRGSTLTMMEGCNAE